jgi:hypothetical protein
VTGDAFPSGRDFFSGLSEIEEACARATRGRLPELGRQAPETLQHLGNVLSLLYREASCFYECPGGDHFAQRMAGRVVTHAVAAYRLLTFGYYDESFALTRNLGEAANLLFLFFLKPELIGIWKASDEGRRRQAFSAKEVRKRLEAIDDGVVPINRTRYASLCEVGVHLTPESAPQAHNPGQRPTLGGVLQEAGLLAALNELSGATGVCGAALGQLLSLAVDRRRTLREASVALLRNVGGVNVSMLRTRMRNPEV